jgi:stearoyl-CoA desaturase (delta-9 desaturase)
MNHNVLLKTFHIANHLVLLVGIYILYNSAEYHYLWYTAIVFALAKIIGVNIGLHRFYSHRSFKTSKFFEYIIAFCSVIATVGSPFIYPGIHRQHHKHSDTDKDPHSPKNNKIKSFVGIWNTKDIQWISIIKDLLRQPFLRFIHSYYFILIVFYILILLLIDAKLAIFAYAIPACLCFWGSSSVNVFAHTWGYQTFTTNDNSTNNIFSSILSLGEGWHNNHHYKPANWNTQVKWWEFDPPAIIIRLIKQ